MASGHQELKFELYPKEILGVGSYGKVCKAKYGQLPCAAKLLHETMFGSNDPGATKFAARFDQECEFLKEIKHPNIVQYLGTSYHGLTGRIILILELMDGNLTQFLERSKNRLPIHIEVNICHDVALALSFLHYKHIVHRDLSSNNVLLIGEGSRAKVADFGMSKLIDNNPRITPLTMCPGSQNYMPPEALITPPRYSKKLDCFSYGVLTIQVLCKKFPAPEAAHAEGSASVIRQVPEIERRQKHIDLINSDHPLLCISLKCLEHCEADRPTADELCENIAGVKRVSLYTSSVRDHEDQASVFHKLSEEKLLRHIEKAQLKSEFAEQLQLKDQSISEYQSEIEYLNEQLKAKKEIIRKLSLNSTSGDLSSSTKEPENKEVKKITWRVQEWQAPQQFHSNEGTTVVHDSIAYFSHNFEVYSLNFSQLPQNQWKKCLTSNYQNFGMAIIENKLTTIGGCQDELSEATNKVQTLFPGYLLFGASWKEVFPPMLTERKRPATASTPTQLVVAGGAKSFLGSTNQVEVLQFDTKTWFGVSCLPQPMSSPQMCLRGDNFYLSVGDGAMFCGKKNEVFNSSVSVWAKLCNAPLESASLVTFKDHILAIGDGDSKIEKRATTSIYRYDTVDNFWAHAGSLPSQLSQALVAVLPSNVVLVLRGIVYQISLDELL